MSHRTKTVLSTLPASETERLVVVLVQTADAGSRVPSSRMELRQQSFSNGIGWFTQSTVHLEPGQVAALRNALRRRLGFDRPFDADEFPQPPAP